jgi:circadian clock protein KaiC
VIEVEKTKTGNKGLDGILKGGFPKNRTILVTGGPGSAKTTFCTQFLCNGVTEYDEPGIYVTIGESPKNIIENMAWYDFDIEGLIDEKKLTFLDLSFATGNKMGTAGGQKADIEILRNTISATAREMNAKRIVIDSVTAMVISLSIEEIREKLMAFSNLSQELKCTTLLTSEMPVGKQSISVFGIEEFIVDGVIILHHIQQRDVRIRGIEVLKMRGTDHGHRIYPFQLSKAGLDVQSEGRVFEEF